MTAMPEVSRATRVIGVETIRRAVDELELLEPIAEGFVAYSSAATVVPAIGEMLFDNPRGEAHIKSAFIPGGRHFVVKVATGFYENAERGIPSSNGVMLLFDQRNGHLDCILLDEGLLTDVRTAVAGAVASRCLAPRRVNRIGIIGTGTQARLQLKHLRLVSDCRAVLVCGRRTEALAAYAHDMTMAGFEVATTQNPAEVATSCNLIVTTTPSSRPLLLADTLRPGTHITAVGSDTAQKNEIDPRILASADRVVADSAAQCQRRGEIHHAVALGLLDASSVIELGSIIEDGSRGRTSDEQITIADLTGVAILDLQIATAVMNWCDHHPESG